MSQILWLNAFPLWNGLERGVDDVHPIAGAHGLLLWTYIVVIRAEHALSAIHSDRRLLNGSAVVVRSSKTNHRSLWLLLLDWRRRADVVLFIGLVGRRWPTPDDWRSVGRCPRPGVNVRRRWAS